MRRSIAKERRRERRTPARNMQARVRPGHRLVIIDLSAGGALVEGGKPLRPGSHIELHLESERWRRLFPALVLRCVVAAIDPEAGVTYRAALAFDEVSDALREWLTLGGYEVHVDRSSSDDDDGQRLPESCTSNVAFTGELVK
jgi:PilZ domain-containing protein